MSRVTSQQSTAWRWQHRDEVVPVWPGHQHTLGATWSPESTNFAVWAPDATAIWICLFDEAGAEKRYQLTEHTLGVWHGAIPDVPVGQLYGLRADGPWNPGRGQVFNPSKLLLDPYARAITGEALPGTDPLPQDPDHPDRPSPVDSAPSMPRCVVTHDEFDWGDDPHRRTRWRDTVIYELHVKGFTELHDRIPEELRGTYAGLGSAPVIDYLRDLGVTAVELLPTQQFFSEPFLAGRELSNYWGYNTIGFFAPHAAYSSSGTHGEQITEFKQMVRNFHAAGIEVYLDVVYNHTAEGGAGGPAYSFRGLDDHGAYKRVIGAPGHYWDVTGCGNTVDTTHMSTLRLILDSLRYWASEMHVDGFRFDLASALARTGYDIDMRSAFLTTVGQDPVLRGVKLIAEPWDTSMDGYLVGSFPSPWVEWNDTYRDAMRDYWLGHGDVRAAASKLSGSSDLYADDGRSPYASVNFVTAHDGFTLRDLVSYDHKHNDDNLEDNRDGSDNNRSANHGAEGETEDPAINALRRRQAANLMVTLCLSSGVPMITAGDERGRTQGGNNNAYCQDNEISWVDWSDDDDGWLEVHDITRAALRLRREHPALRQRHHFAGTPALQGGPKDLAWLHPDGREMTEADWQAGGSSVIGMFVSGDPLRSPGRHGEQQHDASFLLWLNPGPDVTITLPDNQWVAEGEVVLSTDPAYSIGDRVAAGEALPLLAHSLVVLRQTA